MKKIYLLFIAVLLSVPLQAQNKKVKWKEVEVREFTERFSESDTSGKAVIEWFEPTEAGSLSDLFPNELKSIKKKAAKNGCDLVYIDVKGVYKKRKGDIYALAIRRVKRNGAMTD